MNRVIVAVQVCALLALLIAFFFVPGGASGAVIWCCLGIFYCYAWSAATTPLTIIPGIPTFLNIRLTFLIFCYILYYFPYQMHVLGIGNLFDAGRFLGSFVEQTNRAVISATLGIVAFSLGLGRRGASDGVLAASRRVEEPKYPGIDTVAPLALVAAIVIYVGAGWRSSGEGRYTGTASGGVLADGASQIIVMLAMICIASFVVELRSRRRPKLTHWLGLGAAGYWAFLVLGGGDRNTFLLLALVGFAGYFTYVRTIGRVTIAVALSVALIAYNMIEVIRLTGDISWDSIVAYFAQGESGDSRESSFNNTTVTVRAVLYAIPNVFDYGYGMFKLIGFSGIFPFIRGIVLDGSTVFTSTSVMFTYIMLGPHAAWGVGTNVISDIYADFGAIGIPIAMYLMGRYAGAVQVDAAGNPHSRRSTAIYLSSLALIAEVPRYAVDFPVRILVWMALFFWIYGVAANYRSKTARSPQPVPARAGSGARERT